jgi:hypothetical protein
MRRRSTNGLDRKQVNQLTQGWDHAARIGCLLNAMITIRPLQTYDPETFRKLAVRIRNKLGIYARQHGFPFVAAWSRECNRDGTGEHIHVLMHIRPRHFADLEKKVLGWFPEAGAADVRRAHQKVLITETGKRMSAIGYIVKQMTPQASYNVA